MATSANTTPEGLQMVSALMRTVGNGEDGQRALVSVDLSSNGITAVNYRPVEGFRFHGYSKKLTCRQMVCAVCRQIMTTTKGKDPSIVVQMVPARCALVNACPKLRKLAIDASEWAMQHAEAG